MAIRLIEEYPNRVGAPTADYPHGVPRNKSTPAATDGTPFEQSWFRDQEGFFQGLMETAGITPSGQPDTVLNSDYLNALNRVTNGVIEVDMGGAADVALSTYQGRVAALKLIGALAADVDLIVPDTERMYWIIDETTGDFSVTVKTAAGTGVKLFGAASVVRSDGTNVVAYVNGADRRVIYVDTIADLQALDTSALVDGQQVQVKEYHAGTGVGGGEFYWNASSGEAEDGGTIFAVSGVATGRWVRADANTGRVQAVWFGVLGDGSDELTAIRSLADYASGTKRGVDFEPNKIYKYSDYVSFFDAGILDFKESLVIFEHTGNSAGLQLKGQTGIINSRHQNNGTPSGTLGPAGQRDIVALDVKHTEFRNIKFVSGSNNYAPFNILGNSYDLDIDQIEFEDAQWDMGCICHWATVSDSAAVDFSADIAFTPSVGNNTTHPHNIRVGNIKGNSWAPAGSLVSLLFLSGCYNVEGANFTAEQINTIITVIAGDYANEFAPTMIAQFINTGIRLANFSCHQITGTKGVSISGAGVLTTNRTKAGVTLINPNLRSTTAGTRYGIFADHCEDTQITGGTITGFSRSIFGQRNILGLSIDWVTCREATDGGIIISSDEDPNYGVSIRNCKIYNNNQSEGASLDNSGIVLNNARGATISGNKFGFPGAVEKQQHSVYVKDFCDNITLANNHTYDAAQTAAYSGELVTQFRMKLWDGGGNTSETAFIFRPDAHAWYRPLAFNNVQVMLNQTNTAPASGSWNTGDEAIFRNPPAGGFRGAVCTAGGSPGTWKRYGAVEA
jgi:hypothetical protein